MPYTKQSAFTLVEIMVGIAIIMLVGLVATQVNFSRNVDTENRNRFVNHVESMIATARIDQLVGRGMNVDDRIINPTHTILSLSSTRLAVTYESGTLDAPTEVGMGPAIETPFFGDAFYRIDASLHLHNRDTDTWDEVSDVSVVFQGTDISFMGSDIPANEVRIRLGYKARYATITLDRRTGRIETINEP